jgi:tetratricopeptide (TPR) repeat protein
VPFVVPQQDASSFSGRDPELETLRRVLLEDVCPVAGLSGSPGVGKSALAVHFATLFRDRFADGVIGIRVEDKTADAIAREFARTSAKTRGEPFDVEDERDAATIMQSVFSDRKVLLIFDNADKANVRRLIPGGHSRTIITTRDRGLLVQLDIPPAATLQRLDRLEEAATWLERARGIAEGWDDKYSLGRVLNQLGGVLQRLGRLDEAAASLKSARNITEAQNDDRQLVIYLNTLSGVLQQLGRLEEALAALERARGIAESRKDERQQIVVLNSLGSVLQRLGRLEEALKVLERARCIAAAQNDDRQMVIVLNTLGGTLQELDRPDEALEVLERARGIAEKAENDPRQLVKVLNTLSGVLQQLDRPEEALEALERARTITEAHKDFDS